MFKRNKLNAAIAKVTGFIQELEDGITANVEVITKNDAEVFAINDRETADVRALQDKAAVKRTAVVEGTVALQAQNKIAANLLRKLQ